MNLKESSNKDKLTLLKEKYTQELKEYKECVDYKIETDWNIVLFGKSVIITSRDPYYVYSNKGGLVCRSIHARDISEEQVEEVKNELDRLCQLSFKSFLKGELQIRKFTQFSLKYTTHEKYGSYAYIPISEDFKVINSKDFDECRSMQKLASTSIKFIGFYVDFKRRTIKFLTEANLVLKDQSMKTLFDYYVNNDENKVRI